MNTAEPELPLSADTERAVAAWLAHLQHERGHADKTLEAYARDVRQFLGFVATAARLRAVPRRPRHARPQDVPRLSRLAPPARHRQPLAGALALRAAPAVPLARSAEAGREPRDHAARHAEGAAFGAQAADRRQGGRRRRCRPRRRARLGARPRRRRADAALRLGPAHRRGAEHHGPRTRRRPTATCCASRARAARNASCRCCPSCATRSTATSKLCPYPLEPDEPLFRGAKGGPLSPRLIQLAMERLREALDLPATATPHALRHSFATHLLSAGRRPAADPGTARPRVAVDHPGVHRGGPRSAARRL